MALRAALAGLCSVAVLLPCAAQDETSGKCSSHKELLDLLKGAVDCGGTLPADWSGQQTSTLLVFMKNLTSTLHRHQLRDCQGAEPGACPSAEAPPHGGLACVTIANKRYCKPLCNHGFDFSFMRRSRLFDECSEETSYRWNGQFTGGNVLAVCHEAARQVSGAVSAYFPKDGDCLTVKSSSQWKNTVLETFAAELKNQGIQGDQQQACLVCG